MRESSASGLFVTFEGGDGAGKSTQAALLAEHLKGTRHREVEATRQPGGTPLGQSIRELLLHGGDIDERAEALLFAADRAHHVNTVIRPALNGGVDVICDRYIDSSIAYQCGGRGLPIEKVRELSMWGTGELLPDLTVLLDVDPHVAAQRRAARGDGDRIEVEVGGFHERVRQEFRDQAASEPWRYFVVDASQHTDVIAAAVRERVDALLTQVTLREAAHGRDDLSAAAGCPVPTTLGVVAARVCTGFDDRAQLIVTTSTSEVPDAWSVAQKVAVSAHVHATNVRAYLPLRADLGGVDREGRVVMEAQRVVKDGVSALRPAPVRRLTQTLHEEVAAFFEQHPQVLRRMVAAHRLRGAIAEQGLARSATLSYDLMLELGRERLRKADHQVKVEYGQYAEMVAVSQR